MLLMRIILLLSLTNKINVLSEKMVEAACGSMPGLLGPGGNRNLLSENSLNYLRNTGQPLQIQNNHGTKRSIDTDDDDSIPDQASQQDEHCSDLIGASPKHRRSPLLHLLQGTR